MQSLQALHNKALEIIGACDEKIRNLEEDIHDMKHIFHTQLSGLVDELHALQNKGTNGILIKGQETSSL